MTASHQVFITNARKQARAIWDAINALEVMQTQWNALDYGNTLEDGQGFNEGINKTEIGPVLFDTANAIKALFDGGHATNLAKIIT